MEARVNLIVICVVAALLGKLQHGLIHTFILQLLLATFLFDKLYDVGFRNRNSILLEP